MFCESENFGKFLYLFFCFVLHKQPSHVNPTQGVINEAPDVYVKTWLQSHCLANNPKARARKIETKKHDYENLWKLLLDGESGVGSH